MKRSLIAAAVGAALMAPVAQASVVVYGNVHVSIDHSDVSLGAGFNTYGFTSGPITDPFSANISLGSQDQWNVTSRESLIGFKGTEDLGNGLSLIWKAETGYDFADGGNWNSGRNAYIGLTGDWGTFLYGVHDTPYQMSTASLDIFADTAADYNTAADFGIFSTNALAFQDVTATNAIAYISPNMNGLTFAAAIIPGEGYETREYRADTSNPSSPIEAFGSWETHNGLVDAYSVAAMYENNGLYLSAAFENLPGASTQWSIFGSEGISLPVGEQDKYRFGAGYTMNNLTVNAVYEHHERDMGSIAIYGYDQSLESDADIWQVSAAYQFGNSTFKIAYGQGEGALDLGQNTNGRGFSDWFGQEGTVDQVNIGLYSEQEVLTVGFDHALSKRTKVYALYTMLDAEIGGRASANGDVTVGNDAGPFDVGVNGSLETENDVFSIGMVHTF